MFIMCIEELFVSSPSVAIFVKLLVLKLNQVLLWVIFTTQVECSALSVTHIILSLQDKQFKQISSVDQLAIHFCLDGNLIHKESDEARRQLARHSGGEGKNFVISQVSFISVSRTQGLWV